MKCAPIYIIYVRPLVLVFNNCGIMRNQQSRGTEYFIELENVTLWHKVVVSHGSGVRVTIW